MRFTRMGYGKDQISLNNKKDVVQKASDRGCRKEICEIGLDKSGPQ